LFIRLTRALGAEIDDVGKVAMNRPKLFGIPLLETAHDILRGPSVWTVAEREYIAAAVSRANACPFCTGTHGAIAEQLRGNDPPDPRLAAACRFVEKLTRAPDDTTARDAAEARAAGVDDAALAEAIHVAFLFNVMNRLANALDFQHPSDSVRTRGAAMLRRMGYRLPAPLLTYR
jgi:AhpD family alkylhydroperoxidase